MQRTGDLKLIQELNRSIILEVIRKQGPISRSQIAKVLSISPTTVTAAVSDLLIREVVIEHGIGHSSGGRKPVLLRFNPASRSVIGVSISTSYIKIAEMDMEGSILHKKIHSTDHKEGDGFIQLVLECLGNFIKQYVDVERCEGVAIISPGIIDSDMGRIVYNSKIKLYDIDLKQMVEERWGLRTYLENDVNAYVIAEKNLGAFSGYKNILYLTVGDGVGSGILIDGSIYRGKSGSAGEIGHTTVIQGGIKCECGNTGCLENYINWPAVYSKIVSAILTKGRDTLLRNRIANDLNSITPELFVESINQHDQMCIEILEETINYLSIALTNSIHLLNPEIIIVSGKIVEDNPLFLKMINEKVKGRIMPALRGDLKIQTTSLGPNFDLMGAAAIILQGIYKFQLND